jgi:CheY-like chemotaxis protein
LIITQETIDWLVRIEDSACKVYKSASFKFTEDREFADFLLKLSNEEKEHYDFLCEVKEYLKDDKDLSSQISIDNDTKKKIERPFVECKEKMDTGVFTRKEMINSMVDIEFSELNHIFLNVINALKGRSGDFIPMAARIQQHGKNIERFIESQPESNEFLERIIHLPNVLEEKILVVNYYEVVVNLLEDILKIEGIIERASNGHEALEKVSDKYYSVIITDVNMPVMNGIELYNKAVERYPNIKERFLFILASLDEKHLSFFRENNLRYFIKPVPANDIRKAVIDIMNREMRHSATILP